MAPRLNIGEDKWGVHTTPNAAPLFLEHKDLGQSSENESARTRKTEADCVALSRLPQDDKLLQASPYTEHEHLLDLATLSKPLQQFAKALRNMRAVRPDYATAPYDQAFNWDSIVDVFSQTARAHADVLDVPDSLEFFVIVFRSRINKQADRQLLGELDSAAHVEAVEGGGLLKYWFGTPDQNGRNLATCVSASSTRST